MEIEQTPAEQIRAVRNKVKALLKHEERKLAKQRAEAEEAGQYGRYGQLADSLMADPSAAPRGTGRAAVINVHTSEIEEITLNPAFDAVENAELMYRKARRGKRGHETATAMMTETGARVDRLKDVIAGIDNIVKNTERDDNPSKTMEFTDEDVSRVGEIAAEFIPPVILNSRGKPKHEPPPPPFKKYIIDGWEIYLGKNSEQNDELSTRFAKPSDIWLHVAAHAGSHVIIRHKKNTDNPPKSVIEKAAQIAVWHSKAKHTSYAEVHVTEARFVRKRRHAPPGEVIAERCKAVRVEPKDPKLILSAVCALLASAILCAASAQNTHLNLFSAAASPSVISQSLAGAGTAMPLGGFQGLVNPALTTASSSSARAIFSTGFGRSPQFDKLALPFGAVLLEKKGGALGAYYRYLSGAQGHVHDATLNIASRLFEQVDQQGPVDWGANIRYEHSRWRDSLDTEALCKNILFDVGFYQTLIYPGVDFSLVFKNINGYRWEDIDGKEATEGWVGWRHCSITLGTLINVPLANGSLLLMIPFDLEMANLFDKSVNSAYIIRTGIEALIVKMFSVRFGYAHAPENPLDIIRDFDYDNLFYGGFGVFVKPLQFDFFAGKGEFGINLTFWY